MLVGAVLVVLFAAGLGASVAGRISDPVARLTRATRQIAAGRLDVRVVADTADELRRLVDDFNTHGRRRSPRSAPSWRARNQLKAWAEMARQVAHEIKNPLTPIQLAAEHLQRVHEDQRSAARRRLRSVRDDDPATGPAAAPDRRRVLDLRRASRRRGSGRVAVADLVEDVVGPYRPGLGREHRDRGRRARRRCRRCGSTARSSRAR